MWARVATGSWTVVAPSAPSPAKSTADLTWGGYRERVLDALEAAAPHGQRREAAVLPAVDLSAHEPERYCHPVHRPPGDRGVALEHGEPINSRDEAGQQADAGAGITDVDEVLGLPQAPHAAVDVQLVADPLGPGAQRHNRFQGVADIVTVRQPFDERAPFGAAPLSARTGARSTCHRAPVSGP